MVEVLDNNPEQEKAKDLTFDEKLEFLRDKFLLGGEIKPTREVALPDEEVAEVEFGGDLFVGQWSKDIKDRIKSVFGVDLDEKPFFRIEGEFAFNGFLVPHSDPQLYLLRREIEGETEILAYEETLLEIFCETEGLERIDL